MPRRRNRWSGPGYGGWGAPAPPVVSGEAGFDHVVRELLVAIERKILIRTGCSGSASAAKVTIVTSVRPGKVLGEQVAAKGDHALVQQETLSGDVPRHRWLRCSKVSKSGPLCWGSSAGAREV